MNKKKMFLFSLLLVVSIGIFYHTSTLVITYHSKQVGQGKRSIKIAHVTDLHSSTFGLLEEQLFKALEVEKPDVIFITGDLATPNGEVSGYQKILSKFKAPKGVYFVHGNWEYWEPIENLEQLLSGANIQVLTNKTYQLEKDLWLVGFDDSETGNPNLEVLNQIPTSATKLALIHSPQFFDQLIGKINIAFAGHSHGGQIRVPFIDALWVPAGTGKYTAGWFEAGVTSLFVSRGIGTSLLPIRFNCSPELAIVTVKY